MVAGLLSCESVLTVFGQCEPGSTHNVTPESFVAELRSLGRSGIGGNPPNAKALSPYVKIQKSLSGAPPSFQQYVLEHLFIKAIPDESDRLVPSTSTESSIREYGRNPSVLPLWLLLLPLWRRLALPRQQDPVQTFYPGVLGRLPLLRVSIRGFLSDGTRRRRRVTISRLAGFLEGKRRRRRGYSRCVGIEREVGRLGRAGGHERERGG